MDDTSHVTLLFDPNDYVAAKDFLAERVGVDKFETDSHGKYLYDGMELAGIILDLTKTALPIVASIVALWLGKGKNITVKMGNKTLKLRNFSEDSSKDIVHDFLKANYNKEIQS